MLYLDTSINSDGLYHFSNIKDYIFDEKRLVVKKIKNKDNLRHSSRAIVFNEELKTLFSLEESLTGCGLVLMHHISSYMYDIEIGMEDWLYLLHFLTTMGIGAIMATSGESSQKYLEPFFLKYGFREVDNFVNYQHGNNYYQKIFILNIKDFLSKSKT